MPNFSTKGGKMGWIVIPAIVSFIVAIAMLTMTFVRYWMDPVRGKHDLLVRTGALATAVYTLIAGMLLLLRPATWEASGWLALSLVVMVAFGCIIVVDWFFRTKRYKDRLRQGQPDK